MNKSIILVCILMFVAGFISGLSSLLIMGTWSFDFILHFGAVTIIGGCMALLLTVALTHKMEKLS